MKLINGNPAANKIKSYSVEERTFTLTPHAMAIVEHFTNIFADKAESFDHTLDVLLLTLDSIADDLGLNDKEVTISESGTTYSFKPKTIITTPELRAV
ncbi:MULTISPECIES: hypothetical protein [Pseudomonas]|uniref:Uncharacterized protein n=1 Tax=Pseudomonas fulva TaxID=47880 RepID=A0A0D0KL21_9PSED|nr:MULTISPECIES: hypothetical protein [Pseudomonas]KIP98742.1 hypothetical protein RU08_14810 [Pseudomonas fulva]